MSRKRLRAEKKQKIPVEGMFAEALKHHQAGRLIEAERLYQQVLIANSRHADSLQMLGVVAQQTGRGDLAVNLISEAIAINAKVASYHSNLGNVLLEQGRPHEAAGCYGRALDLKPDYPEAHHNLGVALREQGRLDEAAACYRRALDLKPDYWDAHINLGSTLQQQGRLDEAVVCYGNIIRLRPDYPEAHNNLGTVLNEQGRLDEAVMCYRKALDLRPDYWDPHYNLGNALKERGRLDEAVVCYGSAIRLRPGYPEAHNNLGIVLCEQGHLDEALRHYAKAVEIKPNYFAAFSNRLFTYNYLASQAPESLCDMARQFGVLASSQVGGRAFRSWREAPPGGKLRVGLVSGDLFNHPVSYFLESLLKTVDPARVEFLAFPSRNREDKLTARIKPFFTAWEPIQALSDEAAANLIHANGVQVLLDLSGHTAYNRLPVFAWRPAPVQATWLGYFATTGIAEMDYIIGDPRLTPTEETDHFTEAAWRLPDLSSCFTPPVEAVEISRLPALSDSYVTFGCFNNLTKVNDAVVAVWARVLKAVPLSRLMLKAKQFREETVCRCIRARFAAHGITEDRLLIEPPSSRIDYLRAYHRIDIALDPFPYPGGATSFEALWMGLPVLTKRGSRFLSNAGETIMRNAGLPDWIANDDDEYVAKAIGFASDPGHLEALRSRLRRQILASPLCDAPRFARHFEEAMAGMWNRWLSMH